MPALNVLRQGPVEDGRVVVCLAAWPASTIGIAGFSLPHTADQPVRTGRVEDGQRVFPVGKFEAVDESGRAVAQQRHGGE